MTPARKTLTSRLVVLGMSFALFIPAASVPATASGSGADGVDLIARTPDGYVQVAQPAAPADPTDVYDPFEPVNRGIFAVNEAVDIVIVAPVATVYRGVVPSPLRNNVQSFLRNLRSPVILANNVLQGDWAAAENTLARFFVNSTLGLGGIADVATAAGLPYQSADFGQTLGRWGAGPGPYIVLPLLGPSNLRDSVGTAVDMVADPVSIGLINEGAREWNSGRTVATVIDTRSRFLDEVTDLRENSIDYYATMRSLTDQSRRRQIQRVGSDPSFDFPEFEDFEDFEDLDAAPVQSGAVQSGAARAVVAASAGQSLTNTSNSVQGAIIWEPVRDVTPSETAREVASNEWRDAMEIKAQAGLLSRQQADLPSDHWLADQ